MNLLDSLFGPVSVQVKPVVGADVSSPSSVAPVVQSPTGSVPDTATAVPGVVSPPNPVIAAVPVQPPVAAPAVAPAVASIIASATPLKPVDNTNEIRVQCASITAMCNIAGKPSLAAGFIEKGLSIADVQTALTAMAQQTPTNVVGQPAGVSEEEGLRIKFNAYLKADADAFGGLSFEDVKDNLHMLP